MQQRIQKRVRSLLEESIRGGLTNHFRLQCQFLRHAALVPLSGTWSLLDARAPTRRLPGSPLAAVRTLVERTGLSLKLQMPLRHCLLGARIASRPRARKKRNAVALVAARDASTHRPLTASVECFSTRSKHQSQLPARPRHKGVKVAAPRPRLRDRPSHEHAPVNEGLVRHGVFRVTSGDPCSVTQSPTPM